MYVCMYIHTCPPNDPIKLILNNHCRDPPVTTSILFSSWFAPSLSLRILRFKFFLSKYTFLLEHCLYFIFGRCTNPFIYKQAAQDHISTNYALIHFISVSFLIRHGRPLKLGNRVFRIPIVRSIRTRIRYSQRDSVEIQVAFEKLLYINPTEDFEVLQRKSVNSS